MAFRGTNHKGGRPLGKKSKKTLEREAILKVYLEKIMKSADKLFIAQSTLALGQSYLYVIRTITVGSGKNAKRVKQKPELVEDPETIEAYLRGDFEGDEDEYYYITTKEPDGKAISSMFDRLWGRPVQAVTPVDADGEPLPVVAINVLPLTKIPKK